MRIRCIRAPNPGPFTLDGTNSYVLGDEAIVDPGPAVESHILALLEVATALRTIFITHRHGDHAPAATELKKRSGARVIAPVGVRPVVPVDDEAFDGRVDAVAGSDLTTVATPGHTEEHVCFLTAERDLFTGDTILGTGTTAIFPPDGRMGDYLRSLERLRELEPRRIYPGHGPVVEDPLALIDGYITHRREREEQIVRALEGGPLQLGELRRRVYPDLADGLEMAAEAQLEAHLIHLQELSRVRNRLGWELTGSGLFEGR